MSSKNNTFRTSLISGCLGAALGAGGALYIAGFFNAASCPPDTGDENGLRGPVASVYDGDTLRLATGKSGKTVTVRIWGIDAPELKQTCAQGTKPVACGETARAELARIAAGKTLSCEKKSQSYQRIVAVCFADGADIGREMVRRGHAFAERRYARGHYAPDEESARAAKAGLWGMKAETPDRWRACNLPSRRKNRPADCAP